MIKIGLTGNSGGGKTTAINFLRATGENIISADKINSSCRQHSKFLATLLETILDSNISNDNKKIDAAKLRELVFSSSSIKQSVEDILHPIIMENIDLLLALQPVNKYGFIEIPLLHEADLYSYVDSVLLVTANHEKLTERIIDRDKLTKNAANKVLKKQCPDNEKFSGSNDIVLNSSSPEAFRSILERLKLIYS